MRPRHLVVFAKPPRLGRVKTRLAADIGALAAWRFYRGNLNRVLVVLRHSAPWHCWLALPPTPTPRPPRLPLAAGEWRLISQGAGDLGARMGRIMKALPPGPAVIVGSDIPGVTAAAVEHAFTALKYRDVVFGPAPDGGYWLVGMRRSPRVPDLFVDVRWSSPFALADTLRNAAGLTVGELALLDDVDTGTDYHRWRTTASTRAWGR